MKVKRDNNDKSREWKVISKGLNYQFKKRLKWNSNNGINNRKSDETVKKEVKKRKIYKITQILKFFFFWEEGGGSGGGDGGEWRKTNKQKEKKIFFLIK